MNLQSLKMPPAIKQQQRNNFLVDTKSTCFLCLKEIPRPPPVVIKLEVEDNEDEEAESQGDGEGDSGDGPEVTDAGNKNGKFCLRTIYNYLKMNGGQVLSRKLAGVPGLGMAFVPLLNNTDLSVLLCEDCTDVSSSLSNLCEELEALQILVNDSLEKFLEVLSNSERDSELMTNFRSKLTNPLDQLQASMAEHLRKATQEKCSQILRFFEVGMDNSSTCGVAAPPLIDLEMEKEDLTIPVLIPSSSSSTLKSVATPPPPSMPQTDVNSTPTPKTMVIPGRFKCNLCGLAYSNINSVYKHKKKKHSNAGFSVKKRHTCKACGTLLQSKIEWIRHTRLHCNQRQSLKQDNSNEQAVTIPKLKDLTQLMSPVLQVKSGNNRLVCALCPPPSLQFNKTSQLRKHLFCNHPEYVFDPVKLPEKDAEQFNELCVELIRDEMALSQQESDEQQDQGDNDDGTSNAIAYTCVYCSYVCHEKRTMNVHLIQGHYEVLCSTLVDLQNHHSEVSSVEMAPSSPPLLRPTADGSGWARCQDCGKLLKVGSSFNRHRRLYCEKRINASTGVSESVTSDKKSGRKRRLEEQGTENEGDEQFFGGYGETDTLDENEDENDDMLPGSFLNVKCEVLGEMERQEGDSLLDTSSMEEEDGE